MCMGRMAHGTEDAKRPPATICRKVIEAIDRDAGKIIIWGDDTATRSFTYIDDCLKRVDMIMHCTQLIAV